MFGLIYSKYFCSENSNWCTSRQRKRTRVVIGRHVGWNITIKKNKHICIRRKERKKKAAHHSRAAWPVTSHSCGQRLIVMLMRSRSLHTESTTITSLSSSLDSYFVSFLLCFFFFFLVLFHLADHHHHHLIIIMNK